MKLLKIILAGLLALLFLGFVVSILSHDVKTTSKSNATDDTTKKKWDGSYWVYSSDVDKMTSKTNYEAYVKSDMQLELKFPYDNGENYAYLTTRLKNGKTDVYLQITKGQLIAATPTNEGAINVRFDDGTPEQFGVAGAADYSSNIVFINYADYFLKKLKKSKRVIIEAAIYDNGNQQMEFATEGLKWNH